MYIDFKFLKFGEEKPATQRHIPGDGNLYHTTLLVCTPLSDAWRQFIGLEVVATTVD